MFIYSKCSYIDSQVSKQDVWHGSKYTPDVVQSIWNERIPNEGKCVFEIHQKKTDIELNNNFHSFIDMSFLNHVIEIFCTSFYFQKKNWSVFGCVCIYFIKVKELLSCKYFIYGLWETSKEMSCIESFSHQAAILKCIPSLFYGKLCLSISYSP